MATIQDILFSNNNLQIKFRGTWNSVSGVLPNTTTYEKGSVLQVNGDATIGSVFFKDDSFIININGVWERFNSYTYNDLVGKPVLGSAAALNATEAGTAFITLTNNSTEQNTARSYLGFSSVGSSIVTAANENAVLTILGIPTDLVTQLGNKQPLDDDLTAIGALSGTNGLLRKTNANTWALDTNTYLTGNQTINFSGSVTGSGTTNISLMLTDTGVAAGEYTKIQVASDGRVVSGSNPTTLSGYGITDAAPLTHVGSGGSSHALATGSSHGFLSSSNFTKIEGVESEATKNSSDAYLLNLANQTGTLPQNKVENLVSDLAAKELLVNKVADLSAPNTTTYIHTQGLAAALAAIAAGQNYLGEWNSLTNTPTIISSTGTEGDYYRVSVASSGVTVIDGEDVWNLGDKILFSDGTWKREQNYQLVTSVNGETGPVVLDKVKIGLPNVDNTSDVNKPVSTAQQTALNLKENLSNKVGDLVSPNANTYIHTQGLTTVLSNYISGLNSSVDNEIVLFSGTTGRIIKRGSVVGNAAYATIVSSQTDLTSTRLMNRTYLGIGVSGSDTLPNYATFSAVPQINALTAIVNAGAIDAPSRLGSAAFRVEVNGSGTNWSQKAFARISGSTTTNEVFAWRSFISSDGWSSWRYPFDTGNVSSDVNNLLSAANNAGILSSVGAAPLNNATFTGTTSGVTATKGDATTKFATTAFVKVGGKRYQNVSVINANTTLTANDLGKTFIVTNNITITLPQISTIFSTNTERNGETFTFNIVIASDDNFVIIARSGADIFSGAAPLADSASLNIYSGEKLELTCDASSTWYVTDWVSRRPLKIEACPTSTEVNANNYTRGGAWLTPATGLTNFPASVITANARAIINVSGNASGISQTVNSQNSDGRIYTRTASTFAGLVGTAWVEEWNSNNLVKTTNNLDNVGGKVITNNIGWMGLGGAVSSVTDMTSTDLNIVRIFRMNSTATGGNGFFTGAISLPLDGTPNTGYLGVTINGIPYVGRKLGVNGSPAWNQIWDAGSQFALGSTLSSARTNLELFQVAWTGSATDLSSGVLNDARLPTTMSGKTFSGNILVSKVDPVIQLRDTDSTSATMSGYVEFLDSTNTSISYIGHTGTSTFNIRSAGDISIQAGSAATLLYSSPTSWNLKSRTTNISNLNFFGNANNFQGTILTTNNYIGLASPFDGVNPVLRVEGVTTYVKNNLTQGEGSGQVATYINGGSSGTNSGSATYYANNGNTACAIGNYSAVMGGAYNANAVIYSANTLNFVTGGTSQATTIQSNGNVCINNSTDLGLGNLQVTGNVYSSGKINAGNGFSNHTFVENGRSPIWRFNSFDAFGLSYFDGSAGVSGNDCIGFHFGTATSAASSLNITANGILVNGTSTTTNLSVTTSTTSPQLLFGTSSSAGSGVEINGGIRAFSSGSYNYGMLVNNSAGGLELHANQGTAGQMRFYTGGAWNSSILSMTLDNVGGLTLSRSNAQLVAPIIKATKYLQTLQTLGNVSGTVTINCNLGIHVTMTLVGNTTLAFSNLNSSTEAIQITLQVNNGGNYTFTMPAGTTYTGGTPPTFTSGGKDIFVFTKAGNENLSFYMSSKDNR